MFHLRCMFLILFDEHPRRQLHHTSSFQTRSSVSQSVVPAPHTHTHQALLTLLEPVRVLFATNLTRKQVAAVVVRREVTVMAALMIVLHMANSHLQSTLLLFLGGSLLLSRAKCERYVLRRLTRTSLLMSGRRHEIWSQLTRAFKQTSSIPLAAIARPPLVATNVAEFVLATATMVELVIDVSKIS